MQCPEHEMNSLLLYLAARSGAVVETLRYKPEGHGINSDGVIGIFH
jgi:hypothetical protein